MVTGPLVSIIVPTYNRANVLPKTIESVLGQTYTNLELIIVDDASTDGTYKVIHTFLDDNRIQYYRNSKNCGESFSVNLGWSKAKGNLVSIVNSDDPQLLNWLSCMLEYVKNYPGYVIYYPSYQILDLNRNLLGTVKCERWSKSNILGRLRTVSSAGAVINKTLLPEKFLPRINTVKYPSDLFQSINLVMHGDGLRVDEVLGQWTLNPESNLNSENDLSVIKNFETNILEFFNESESEIKSFIYRSFPNLYSQIWRFLRHRNSLCNTIQHFPWGNFLQNCSNVKSIFWLVLELFIWKLKKIKQKFDNNKM